MGHPHRLIFLSIFSLFVFCFASVFAEQNASKEHKRLKSGELKPIFGTITKRGVSIAARDIQPRVRPKMVEKKKERTNRLRRPQLPIIPFEDPSFVDSALQASMPFGGGMPGPIITFDGIENLDNNSSRYRLHRTNYF